MARVLLFRVAHIQNLPLNNRKPSSSFPLARNNLLKSYAMVFSNAKQNNLLLLYGYAAQQDPTFLEGF